MTAKRIFFIMLGFAALFALLPGPVAGFFAWGALNMACGVGLGTIFSGGKWR